MADKIHTKDDDTLLRQYLLGALSDDEQSQTEQRLLADKPFADLLPVNEDELFDDYISNRLSQKERRQFDRYFLSSPTRRKKLVLAKSLRLYVNKHHPPVETPLWERVKEWLKGSLPIRILIPVTAVLLFGAIGVGSWHLYQRKSGGQQSAKMQMTPAARAPKEVGDGLLALMEAYAGNRTSEIRISGFPYSSFSEPAPHEALRGGGNGQKNDDPRMARARTILSYAAEIHKNSASFHALGKYYLARGEFDDAISEMEKALNADPSAKNIAQLQSDLGAAYLGRGIKIRRQQEEKDKASTKDDPSSADRQEGLTSFGKSLEHLDRALELDGSLLEALFNRGLCHYYMFLPQQAQQAEDDWNEYLRKDPNSPWANEARKYLKEIQDKKQKAALDQQQLFDNFIKAYKARDGTKAKEIACQSRSRTGNVIAERLIDSYLELGIRGQTAAAQDQLKILDYLGKLEAGFGDRFISDLARFYRKATPRQMIALVNARRLMQSGYTSYRKSDFDKSLIFFREARQTFESVGDFPEAMFAEFHIGRSYGRQPNLTVSFSIFSRLIYHTKRTRYQWLLAESTYNLATTQMGRNEYSDALAYGSQATALIKPINDTNEIINHFVTVGEIHKRLGDHQRSLSSIEQALAYAKNSALDIHSVRRIYAGSSLSFAALGLHTAAVHYQKEVLKLDLVIGAPLNINRTLAQLGITYAKLSKYSEALRFAQQAYQSGQSLAQTDNGKNMIAYASLQLGEIHRQAGNADQAIHSYQEAIRLYETIGNPQHLYSAHKGIFLTYVSQTNYFAARRELEIATRLFDDYRSKIREESNRNSFFDSGHDIYDLAIDFEHSTMRNIPRAFEYSEIGRARSLLDMMNKAAQTIESAAGTEIQISQASSPLGLAIIQQQMPDKVEILQYAALEDKLVVWLVSKKGFFSNVENIGYTKLNEMVTSYLQTISNGKAEEAGKAEQEAKELYARLIKPIESHLDRSKRLCIVPDKVLYHLPFGSLLSADSNKNLLEDFTLIYAPSASVFIKCTEIARDKDGAPGESVLSIGNPRFDRKAFRSLEDLPESAVEARKIASYYPARQVLTGAAATESRIRGLLADADVIHFATHAVTNQQSPTRSSLVLTPGPPLTAKSQEADGQFQASEIYPLLFPRTRLVVLSACQTGVELTYRGEGAVSLARPFIAAKVPLVVASFWPVKSKFTEKLMTRFHQYRKTGKDRKTLSTAEALRQAQIDMLRGEDSNYHYPYYWASFMTIGGYAKF